MFLLTFLVVNTAATRRELDNDLFTVSGIMQKYNCVLKRLDFQQEQGLISSLPLGYNGIEIQRGMTTSSTAIFVPFMTQELRMDGEAIYYGLNALSHNVIMANRKKLKNPNGLYLGVPGSGKSFSGKRELVNVFLATSDRIIILDPMGEYSPLVRQFGEDGLVVEIAPNSPHHINPMDLDVSMDDEVSPISLKCDFILSLMELIVGGKDGLQPVERTIIDRCARMVYRDFLNDPDNTPLPTLQDLYDLLCQQTEPEAKRLATALEIYVSGSLNLFNHKTNVDYEAFGVTYDAEKDQWYFNGEEVRYFRDVLTSNGESLTSGKFRGEMRTLGSGVGTIDIYTVRDYGHLNSEHHGTLTGIEKYSQDEFDEHTQAGMSGNQPIGNASHN